MSSVSHVTSNSKTERARELKFWDQFYILHPVTCYVSHVIWHMSYFIGISIIFFNKVIKLVGGLSVINESYPVHFFLVNKE